MADDSPRGKAPAFQWYPGDFRRDIAVQACSFEARSLWREMIDLMHDGEPYGHLTAGGVPITPAQLARIVGVSPAKVRRWMKELDDRNVYSVTDDGVIYSRRMVRDAEVRRKRAAGGSKGGNPALLKGGEKDTAKVGGKDNLRANLQPTPASASASASAKSTDQKEIPLSGNKERAEPAKPRPWKSVPDKWQPKDRHREEAARLGLDLAKQVTLYRNHRFKEARVDPDRTFDSWLIRAADYEKRGGGARQQHESAAINGSDRRLEPREPPQPAGPEAVAAIADLKKRLGHG